MTDETDLRETESIDVFELIETLIAEVQEAKSVPLSGNILIDRDWITERLQKLQADLPN